MAGHALGDFRDAHGRDRHLDCRGGHAAPLGLARRHPLLAALLVLPWALVARPSYGSGPRGLARAASELPARMAVDVAETAAMVRGSVRHRTPML